MRNLQRNQRDLYYAVPVGTKPIYDEYGNDTLEVETIYDPPVKLSLNVSANAGMDSVAVFGSHTEYSRTISISGDTCPLGEDYPVWFGVAVEKPNNYRVAKVADSKNGFLVALQEVAGHG